MNRGSGFGLEIPVDYIFYGGSRVTIWIKKDLEKLDKSLYVKIENFVKQKHLKIIQ